MEIICPECQFSREVDETKIPARSQVATCPKCKTKFKFRELPEELDDFGFVQDETAPEATPDAGAIAPAQEPAAPSMAQPPEPMEEENASYPPEEDGGPVFPHIAQPGETPEEEIWDRLHAMAPPKEADSGGGDGPQTRKPPVIGAKWKPKEDAGAENDDPWNSASIPKSLPLEDDQPVPGWTGQFSEDFPDPMVEELGGGEEDGQGPLVPPPFEQLDRYGFFHGLYMTIRLILFSPRLFFSAMPVGGGLSKPLTFTILLALVQSIVQYFWGLAGLSGTLGMDGTEQAAGAPGLMMPIIMLLFVPAFIAAGQFIMTFIYHVLLLLMKAGDEGFEGTFRALAYANAPIILGIFPMPMPAIEIGWMFLAAMWGLFLTIVGLKHIHKTTYAKVIPVALIPLLLGMIAGLYAFQAGLTTI